MMGKLRKGFLEQLLLLQPYLEKLIDMVTQHPADRIDLGSKNCYSLVTYTHELPMGPAFQNRFWLFHICPSGENSDLQKSFNIEMPKIPRFFK